MDWFDLLAVHEILKSLLDTTGKEWQPTPVFLPGEPHGQGTLVRYSPWGCKEVRHNCAAKHSSMHSAQLGRKGNPCALSVGTQTDTAMMGQYGVSSRD